MGWGGGQKLPILGRHSLWTAPRMGICIALLFRADFCNWQRHSTFLLASLLAIFANRLLLYFLHLIHDNIWQV